MSVPDAGNPPAPHTARLRLAELSSSVGAAIIGVGVGVLLASFLAGLGGAILALGLGLHAWGMADRHRIEAEQGAPRIWWSTLLYWICWGTLAAMLGYVLWRARA